MQRIYQQDVNWFGFSFNLSKFQKGWIDEYDFHDNVTHSPHPLTPLNDGNIRSIRDLIQFFNSTFHFHYTTELRGAFMTISKKLLRCSCLLVSIMIAQDKRSGSLSSLCFVAVQYNKFASPSWPIDGWRALKLPSNKRLGTTLRLN
jgi:hypothetical protein